MVTTAYGTVVAGERIEISGDVARLQRDGLIAADPEREPRRAAVVFVDDGWGMPVALI